MTMVAARLRDPWNWIAGAAMLFLLLFVVLPLLQLFSQSFFGQRSGAFGLENYATFFGSRYFLRALFNSITVGVLGTLLALILGVPLAYLCARYVVPGMALLRVLVIMAMMSPPFLGAYAWIILFGRAGIVTSFFRRHRAGDRAGHLSDRVHDHLWRVPAHRPLARRGRAESRPRPLGRDPHRDVAADHAGAAHQRAAGVPRHHLGFWHSQSAGRGRAVPGARDARLRAVSQRDRR
jgi:hypothetical protein